MRLVTMGGPEDLPDFEFAAGPPATAILELAACLGNYRRSN
jgi:hypothetical protein